MYPRLASNLWSFCLGHINAKILGMSYQAHTFLMTIYALGIVLNIFVNHLIFTEIIQHLPLFYERETAFKGLMAFN